jgi:NADH:ubiquinone oxidoreductase subunit 4 (subunit M)
MGFFLIGIVSFSPLSFKGSLILLISHGFVSSLLFLLIGMLYVRTNTRYLLYFKGIATNMPIFSIFLFLSLLLNASLPPSLSFIAEFLILQGAIQYEIIGTIHLLLSVLLAGIYSLFLFCKISFTTLPSHLYFSYSNDITLREFIILFPLIFLSISLSLLPF